MRPDGSADGSSQRALVRIPLRLDAPSAAREAIAVFKGRIPQEAVDRALVVVTELVTNSLRHSGMNEGDEIQLLVQLSDARMRLEVADRGRDSLRPPRRPAADALSGRGLWLVDQLSDDWGWWTNGGLRVWAEMRWESTTV